jgi:hypothetical protein
MARLLVPNDGVRGIDIETPRGTIKIDADKAGAIEITDQRTLAALKAEGFTSGATAAGFGQCYPCDCGHPSVFRVCGKCGKDNG